MTPPGLSGNVSATKKIIMFWIRKLECYKQDSDTAPHSATPSSSWASPGKHKCQFIFPHSKLPLLSLLPFLLLLQILKHDHVMYVCKMFLKLFHIIIIMLVARAYYKWLCLSGGQIVYCVYLFVYCLPSSSRWSSSFSRSSSFFRSLSTSFYHKIGYKNSCSYELVWNSWHLPVKILRQ